MDRYEENLQDEIKSQVRFLVRGLKENHLINYFIDELQYSLHLKRDFVTYNGYLNYMLNIPMTKNAKDLFFHGFYLLNYVRSIGCWGTCKYNVWGKLFNHLEKSYSKMKTKII